MHYGQKRCLEWISIFLNLSRLDYGPECDLSWRRFREPTAGHTHRGNQNRKKHMYPNVHHSTVYNSQDMEAT